MKHFPRMIFACLIASTAQAQVDFIQSPAYRECTRLASSNPAVALTKAEEWLKLDTGIASNHCRAMALYGLRRFDEAGTALDAVREAVPRENVAMRSYVTQQAARAWVNANRADAALNTLGNQISDMNVAKGDNAGVAKLTAELLLARARIHLTYGKLAEATQDLDQAISLTPLNEDLLLARASAFEQLGDIPLARADAQSVLRLSPGNAKATDLLRRMDERIARKIPERP